MEFSFFTMPAKLSFPKIGVTGTAFPIQSDHGLIHSRDKLLEFIHSIIFGLPIEIQLAIFQYFISQNFSLSDLYNIFKSSNDGLLSTAVSQLMLESSFKFNLDFKELSCNCIEGNLRMAIQPGDYFSSLCAFLIKRSIKSKRIIITVYRDFLYQSDSYEHVALLDECFEEVQLCVCPEECFHLDYSCSLKNLYPQVKKIKFYSHFPDHADLQKCFPNLRAIKLTFGYSIGSKNPLGNWNNLEKWLSENKDDKEKKKLVLQFRELHRLPEGFIQSLKSLNSENFVLRIKYDIGGRKLAQRDYLMDLKIRQQLSPLKQFITSLSYHCELETADSIDMIKNSNHLKRVSLNKSLEIQESNITRPYNRLDTLYLKQYNLNFCFDNMNQVNHISLTQIKLTSELMETLPQQLKTLQLNNCMIQSYELRLPLGLESFEFNINLSRANFLIPMISNPFELLSLSSVSILSEHNRVPSEDNCVPRVYAIAKFIGSLPKEICCFELKLHSNNLDCGHKEMMTKWDFEKLPLNLLCKLKELSLLSNCTISDSFNLSNLPRSLTKLCLDIKADKLEGTLPPFLDESSLISYGISHQYLKLKTQSVLKNDKLAWK